MSEPPLHQLCAPVAFLLGEWRGEGHGGYSGMAPFRYGEEMRVWHVGKPYLAFEQRTWQLDDVGAIGRLLHVESGYLRCLEGGSLELAVAMAPGHAEVSTGRVEGSRISLESVGVLDAPSAARVSAVKRTWWLEGDLLRYEVEMAALDQPMGWHLAAELRGTWPGRHRQDRYNHCLCNGARGLSDVEFHNPPLWRVARGGLLAPMHNCRLYAIEGEAELRRV